MSQDAFSSYSSPILKLEDYALSIANYGDSYARTPGGRQVESISSHSWNSGRIVFHQLPWGFNCN